MNLKVLLFTISILSGTGAGCHAGGYLSPWLGSWYLGLSGSGTAGIQDPGTILINPATACWLSSNAVQVNGGLNWADVGFLRTGSLESIGTRTAAFSSFSATAVWRPADDSKWAWGLAIYSPYSLAVQWPEDWDAAQTSQELFVNSMYIMPSANLRLGETFSLGLAVGGGVTNLSYSRALSSTPEGNVLPHQELNGQRFAMRLHAGLVWEASYNLKLGLSYQHDFGSKEIEGEATFIPPMSFEDFYKNTGFSFTLPAPAEARLGLVYDVDPDWKLFFDLHWANWTVMDTLKVDFRDNTTRLTDDMQVWEWSNTLAFRAGSVWDLGEKAKLLAGFAFEPDPVDNNRLSPILPDATRISVSGGLSWQVHDHLGLQIAGAYRLSGERLGSFTARNFGGTYQLQDISAQIGLNWRW
jgi:long-chain fatty acid transport protein